MTTDQRIELTRAIQMLEKLEQECGDASEAAHDARGYRNSLVLRRAVTALGRIEL